MPIIPLITRSSPLAPAAAPVLDRERRPTVDTRGQQQAVGNLAKAGQMPDVPMSLAEPYSALGAVGRAVQQGGDLVSALEIKRREAESDIQIASVDSEMQQERAQFEKWKLETNADPGGWDKEWETRLQALQARIGERTDLHAGAREAIGLRLTRYAGASSAEVAEGAAKETFSRARSVFVGSIDNATEAQNPEQFEEALTTAANKGYLFPHEVERARQRYKTVGEQKTKEAKADLERVEYEVAAGKAIEDPKAWLEANKTPWEGKQILWQRVKNVADAREREGTAEAVASLTDAIASGDLTVPAEVDAWDSKFLTPSLRDQAKRYLASRDRFAEQAERETNGVRNAVEMRQRVKDYDPAKDPDRTEYFELVREVGSRVEQSMAGEITGELYKKYGTEPPERKVRPEIQRNVSKSLDNLFDPAQGAIPWKKEVPVKDNKGRPVLDYNGNPKTETQVDTAAREAALNAQTEVEMRMADWFKDNPDATLPEVKKKVQEFLPDGVQGAFFMSKQKASPSASLRGFVPADDLSDKLPPGLQPHAQDFIDAGKEFGLNPRVLAAISALETAGGTSKAFREKNNAMGISDDKGPIALESVRESIFRQAKTLARPNGPYAKANTLDEFGRIYAPPGAGNDLHGTNGGWSRNVGTWLARL